MRISIVVCLLAVLAGAAWGEWDSSRARVVHLLPLLDEHNLKIVPGAGPAPPASMRMTCGQCHDYDAIRSGWHFAREGNDGRPGEPWVLVDELTGTQLPVSERDWPGAWKPASLGLTPWDMTRLFGRHAPGGEVDDPDPVNALRWNISGQMEVNCLACHNAAPEQNMTEWAIQIARENFRWAATAASGLGIVDGVAARLPDSYDIYDGPNRDNPWLAPPSVAYDPRHFDQRNRVFLDVRRRPPDDRCYFCHSTQQTMPELTRPALDVHHAAGLQCTDCHTNGIDHRIVRGYEGEASGTSCRACHIQDGANASAGRLGAPIAAHRGIPESHFKTLSCTACHAGPQPSAHAGRVRTARANRLGIHGKARWDTQLPLIASPVMLRQDDGPIAPHHALWPAFWGRRIGDDVTPLSLDVVRPEVEKILAAKRSAQMPQEDDAPSVVVETVLESADIAPVLERLAASAAFEGTPVYVSGGALHELNTSGELIATQHAAAEPYVWPFGHDVRPAAQALGARGCADCHADGAPFFYGEVAPTSPLATPGAAPVPMYQLQNLDPALLDAWAHAQIRHTAFLVAAWSVAVLLALILARYGVLGLERIARSLVAPQARD